MPKKKEDSLLTTIAPYGIGALTGVGAYALARKPIWGSKAFSSLRKKFGGKSVEIITKNSPDTKPFLDRLLSGFDKTVLATTKKNIKVNKKGLSIDMRTPAKSNAKIKGSPSAVTHHGSPVFSMNVLQHKLKGLIPKTTILPYTEPIRNTYDLERYVKLISPQLKGKYILKPNIETSRITTPFTIKALKEDTKTRSAFMKVLRSTNKERGESFRNVPGMGKIHTSFYAQKEIPGEAYRMAIVGGKVVPGSASHRSGIVENVKDRLLPSRISKRKNLEKYVQKQLKGKDFSLPGVPKGKAIDFQNPDVIAKFDSKGKVVGAKIVDVNWGGRGYNTSAVSDPISAWNYSRALTGKQPRVLAVAAGATVAVPSALVSKTFIRKKKRE